MINQLSETDHKWYHDFLKKHKITHTQFAEHTCQSSNIELYLEIAKQVDIFYKSQHGKIVHESDTLDHQVDALIQ